MRDIKLLQVGRELAWLLTTRHKFVSKCTKRWKQRSAIKQLLETLFLAIKMRTSFTTDGICMNTMCTV